VTTNARANEGWEESRRGEGAETRREPRRRLRRGGLARDKLSQRHATALFIFVHEIVARGDVRGVGAVTRANARGLDGARRLARAVEWIALERVELLDESTRSSDFSLLSLEQ